MKVDWNSIAEKIGSLNCNGSEIGGTTHAEIAFEEILGEEWIESTVEHIINFKKGREVALNCLTLIHSKKAAEYAYRIYKAEVEERSEESVWLIKHIANPIALDWIEEFLNDKRVIGYGLGVLDQLLWTEQITYNEKVENLFEMALHNSNGELKPNVDFIKEYLRERNKR